MILPQKGLPKSFKNLNEYLLIFTKIDEKKYF